jgi:hypothetical protein
MLRAHIPRLTTVEAADLLRSALSRTHRSKVPSTLSVVRDLVVDVVEY